MKHSVLRLDDYNRCPRCAAMGMEARVKDITWNDVKREFDVILTMQCQFCGPSGDVVHALPLEIANKSQCRCGSILDLGDFSVSQIGDEIKLVATYRCPACGEKSFTEKMKQALTALWRDTTKVSVSPEGVTYEKVGPK